MSALLFFSTLLIDAPLRQLIINLKQSNLSNKDLLVEAVINIGRRCAGYLALALGFLAFLFANNGECDPFASKIRCAAAFADSALDSAASRGSNESAANEAGAHRPAGDRENAEGARPFERMLGNNAKHTKTGEPCQMQAKFMISPIAAAPPNPINTVY